MNCSAVVSPDDGKFFGGAFCCPACHKLAVRLYERGERELKALLLVQHEAIRIALVEGRLQLAEINVDELSKRDVLLELGKLVEAANDSASRAGVARLAGQPSTAAIDSESICGDSDSRGEGETH